MQATAHHVSSPQSDDDGYQSQPPSSERESYERRRSSGGRNSSSEKGSGSSDREFDIIDMVFGDLADQMVGLRSLDKKHLEEDADNLFNNNQERKPQNPELADARLRQLDVSSTDSDYEMPVIFSKAGGTERTIKFTEIFVPNSEKMKRVMRTFNQRQIVDMNQQAENEEHRANKRRLKDDYKNVARILKAKAAHLPVNPFLEDFYYLHSCNKQGTPIKREDKSYKKIQQSFREAYKSVAPNNHMIAKVANHNSIAMQNQRRKVLRSQAIEPQASIKLVDRVDNARMLQESCRVEELKPQIVEPTRSSLKDHLIHQFPAPHYSQTEKQIYAYLKSKESGTQIKPEEVTDHLLQEAMIEQRYRHLQNQGIDVERKKYWGELQDASSIMQLEKDYHTCQKHSQTLQSAKTFQTKFKDVGQQSAGLVENFKEQEDIYQRQERLFASNKSQVTARSIMRYIRHKMGTISDKEFYEQEISEQNAASAVSDQPANKKEPLTSFEENFDVHFNNKRMEIQQEILLKKEKKESANQQSGKQTTTTAYEPISALEPLMKQQNTNDDGAIDTNNAKHERHSDQSVSSDSDSDDEVKDFTQKIPGDRVLPTLGDELNHAKCIKDLSFFKLNWEDADLRNFHRPDISQSTPLFQPVQTLAAPQHKDEAEKRLNPHDYFKDRFKLSLMKGKFCLFEHIDQNPLFVNNFGMASRIKRFFYDDKQPSKKVFSQRNENQGTRHMGPYGELELVGKAQFVDPKKPELGLIPSQRLELLGQINTRKYQGISVLENKMYNAPLFYHSAPRTDFFCTLVQGKQANEQRIVIREMDSAYTVGQLEPKLEVCNPQSRNFQKFQKARATAYISRFLSENPVVKFNDILNYFPHLRDQILKNTLRDHKIEVDRNGECKKTDKFDEEREDITPEMICQYESALHGQYRLKMCGVTRILIADKITVSMGKFNREETDMTLRRVAKLIESEVLSTPWNLSSSFIKEKKEGNMMLIDGVGDPSFGHGGYSFIKMPLKTSGDSLQGAKENRMTLNPAIKNPKAVTQTDADLRKLQKEEIKKKLLKLGYREDVLEGSSRWQMVAMLRQFGTEYEENKKYARGERNTSFKQREMYNANCDKKFEKQMENLSSIAPAFVHNDSEDEPDFTHTDLDNERMNQKQNSTDFTEDIRNFQKDAAKKLSVETTEDQVREIKTIEDIPNYLNLLLLKLDKMPPLPGQQPKCVPMGGQSATQITPEHLESLAPETIEFLKEHLLEKLNNEEINKKQKVICKVIRSLVQLQDGESVNARVIFQSSEKHIKRFQRTMSRIGKDQTLSRSRTARQPGGGSGRNRGLTVDQLQSVTGKSGGSIASKSLVGNQATDTAGAAGQDQDQPLISVKSKSVPKKKKPKKVEPAAPLVKINYTRGAGEPAEDEPITTKIVLKADFPEDANDIQIDLSDQSMGGGGDDGADQDYSQQYEEDVQMLYSPEPTTSRKPAKQKDQAPKRPKLKKQPSTTQRFKSHGFSKDDFDYQQPFQNNRSLRKRQQQSDQFLNQIFSEIIGEMMSADPQQQFHNQVTRQEAPSYRNLIKRPICLKDMKNKTKRNEYKNHSEFMADIDLMRDNCFRYNTEQHPISKVALDLQQLAERLMAERREDILTYESLVQEKGANV